MPDIGIAFFIHPAGPVPGRGGLRLVTEPSMQIFFAILIAALCAYGAYVAVSATRSGTILAPSGRLQSVEAALR